jgi:hypothetical protein
MTLPYNPNAFIPAGQAVVDPVLAKVQALEAVLSKLQGRDNSFATDLVRSYRQYKRLSEKQLYWVGELTKRATPAPAAAPAIPYQAQLLNSEGFARVVELFRKAQDQGLRFPKIRLQTSTGRKIILRMLGNGSKYSGNISVTDNASAYADRTYFGRIDQNGRYFASKSEAADVTQLLKDLSNDPAKMAALYGHQTSHCCFCGLGLTTSESVTVGYGPICAQKFGLPWGEHVETTYTKITLED